MALNPKTSAAARNRALDAAYDVLDSGYLKIYDGTQPTNADTALGAQVLLVTLTLNADSFAAASAGSKAANAITSGTAVATSTATWATFTTSGGTRVFDCSVGTSGADLNLDSVSITTGALVGVSAFTVTQAVG